MLDERRVKWWKENIIKQSLWYHNSNNKKERYDKDKTEEQKMFPDWR